MFLISATESGSLVALDQNSPPAAAASVSSSTAMTDGESSDDEQSSPKVKKFVKKGKGVVDPFGIEKEPQVCLLYIKPLFYAVEVVVFLFAYS